MSSLTNPGRFTTLAKALPRFNSASWKEFSVVRRAVTWRVFGAR